MVIMIQRMRIRIGRSWILGLLVSQCFLTTAHGQGTSAGFVQGAAGATAGSSNSLSLSFPANTVAGDLILVAFDYATNAIPSSVTDSQGNVFTAIGNQLTSPGRNPQPCLLCEEHQGWCGYGDGQPVRELRLH